MLHPKGAKKAVQVGVPDARRIEPQETVVRLI
jgi:hypothetical protein